MKSSSRQSKVGEVKDRLFEVRRAYVKGKGQLIEKSITNLEAKDRAWPLVLFIALMVLGWLIAIFSPITVAKLYDSFGLVPVSVVFFVSYFAFFFVSKVIVKPTVEESSDDTSYIALFSACDRRARRGLLAAGFGVLHTAALLSYLLIKESHWLDLP